MTFRDKHGRTVEIKMIGKHGIKWEGDFFNVGELPYDEESDTYEVRNIKMLLDAASDYCRHIGDYTDVPNKYDIEDVTYVFVDHELYCREVYKDFIIHEFASYEELKAWANRNRYDLHTVYYYGFLENFDGHLYDSVDIYNHARPSWFDDGQTVTIYEAISA